MGLLAYLDSVKARDPAPRSRMEIMIYPGVWALGLHRIAHRLFKMRLFFLARFVNHLSRFLTAIDIHPGAKIGKNFFIDHGVGVVIGETAEIGDNVTMYHGVTLGGTDPANGIAGKRHPTLSDHSIIGSGSQVLGPVIVGERARIGANAVVTKEIPARATLIDAKEYQKSFVPYGTPCSETYDPATQKIEVLQCEMESLRKRLAELVAEREESRPETPDGKSRTHA